MANANDTIGIDPDALRALSGEAERAGRRITEALIASQVEGRKLDDVLKAIGLQLAQLAAQAAVRPLLGLAAGGLANGFGGGLGGASVTEAARPAVQVTMHVTSPDAESFRRAEAQVTANLARAVERGQRGL
jgi:hypothetical protein